MNALLRKSILFGVFLAVFLGAVSFTVAVSLGEKESKMQTCLGTEIKGMVSPQGKTCVVFSDRLWNDILLGTLGVEQLNHLIPGFDSPYKIVCGSSEQIEQAKRAKLICDYTKGD
jgi:hypothetical protein